MSPREKSRGKKSVIPSNIYTVFLALVFSVLLATSFLVAYKCYSQYGKIF